MSGNSPRAVLPTEPSRLRRGVHWLLVAWAILLLPGCRGCDFDFFSRRRTLEDEEKKLTKKERPKEELELPADPACLPGDDTAVRPMAKPGHWFTVANRAKANLADFQGDLVGQMTDRDYVPFGVPGTLFELTSSRPAPLPKGQEKRLEMTFFVPPAEALSGKAVGLHRQLRAAHGGRLLKEDWLPVTKMDGFQYFLIVLASDPDRYTYLKKLTAVDWPAGSKHENETFQHYRVTLPQFERAAPLPAHSLAWTSTAVILWDDLDPLRLTPDQQTALLDWLHWGGQLVISGPNSLERLQGSFLEPVLPAAAVRTRELGPAEIDLLNQQWSLPNAKTGLRRDLVTLPGKPLVGVELAVRDGAVFVPNCGELVAERRVGRGRVAVTAFSLSNSDVRNWGSLDGFVNAVLLRRPPRKFAMNDGLLGADWLDYDAVHARDPRLVTAVRYFTRDVGRRSRSDQSSAVYEPGEEPTTEEITRRDLSRQMGAPVAEPLPSLDSHRLADAAWRFGGYPLRTRQGMATWNDRSGVADAARDGLRDAAGISIPKSTFVLRVLLVYLAVLVPVNWALFRLIGRVEWAWLAAPAIATIGAFVVVRLAQLDIGFARSVTELAVAELYAGHDRAHVTRYTAMYTSLSTSYDLVFADEASLAQPLAAANQPRRPHDATYQVALRHDKELRLSGFRVPSNSTGIVHSEQMIALGGKISWADAPGDRVRLVNGSRLALHGAGVLRRNADGQLEGAWLGDVAPGSDQPLTFAPLPRAWLPPWDEADETVGYQSQIAALLDQFDQDGNGVIDRREARESAEFTDLDYRRYDADGDRRWSPEELRRWLRRTRAGSIPLGDLFELAAGGLTLAPGEARLLAWTADDLPGLAIRPLAAQVRRRTVVLVHLAAGPWPAPQRDQNCREDFQTEPPRAETGDDLDGAATQ